MIGIFVRLSEKMLSSLDIQMRLHERPGHTAKWIFRSKKIAHRNAVVLKNFHVNPNLDKFLLFEQRSLAINFQKTFRLKNALNICLDFSIKIFHQCFALHTRIAYHTRIGM